MFECDRRVHIEFEHHTLAMHIWAVMYIKTRTKPKIIFKFHDFSEVAQNIATRQVKKNMSIQ